MKLILFLGSGVSLASGLPDVRKIRRLLQRRPYHLDPNGRFRRGRVPDPPSAPDRVAQIRRFLSVLAALDARDRKNAQTVFRTETTYEDMAALCLEIRDWANGQNDDATTTPFLRLVDREAGTLLTGTRLRERMKEICGLAYDSTRFIRSVVADALDEDTPVGLDLIVELARSPRISQLDIVTLNHDALVEHLLVGAGIPFVDGFSGADGDVRWYDETLFEVPAPVRLIKLHGSIDWFEFSRSGTSWPAILLTSDPSGAQDGTGKALRSWSQSPSFLTGGRKEAWYQHGIYADLHYRFHEILRGTDRIVMSGYGWADTGITNQLERWLERSPEKRIVLLYEHPKTLVERSKFLATSYDGLVRRRQLIPHCKWLSDTSLSEIESNLA